MPIDFSAADRHIRFCIERDRLSGVSVCAVGPEGVAFSQGYGFRDAAHAVRPDADTVFGVASMSKSITALALAILETEGKVSYEDPVYRYFPSFSVPQRVTLLQIPSNTVRASVRQSQSPKTLMPQGRSSRKDRLRAGASRYGRLP